MPDAAAGGLSAVEDALIYQLVQRLDSSRFAQPVRRLVKEKWHPPIHISTHHIHTYFSTHSHASSSLYHTALSFLSGRLDHCRVMARVVHDLSFHDFSSNLG